MDNNRRYLVDALVKMDNNRRYLVDTSTKEEQTVSVKFQFVEDRKIQIDFTSDCGKFGTDEMLDGYVLTPERLLQILQNRDDYTDDEV